MLVLTSMDDSGSFSSQRAARLFRDPALQERVLGALVDTMLEKGYRGLDVDFEYLPPEDAGAYAAFLARLTERLAPLDLPVLAALRMTPDGAVDTLVFGSKTLDVKTLAVDPETFSLNDIKDQARYPVTFRELLPYIAGLVVLAGLAVLAVWLIRRWRSRAVDAAQKRDPAHIVALRRLEGMRGNGMWIPEKQKAFYSGVTDILREYIVARYGIQAVEMTTAEIFSRLAEKDVPSGGLHVTCNMCSGWNRTGRASVPDLLAVGLLAVVLLAAPLR